MIDQAGRSEHQPQVILDEGNEIVSHHESINTGYAAQD